MRFLFLSTDQRPIQASTLEERPMGAGVSSIIRLSQALSDIGHEVFVTTSLESPPPSKPFYIPLSILPKIGPVDVLIAVRGWTNVVLHPVVRKKCFYWTGDTMYNPKTLGIGDKRVIELFDAVLFKSQWQAAALCEVSGFPPTKSWILSNGLNLKDFAGTENRKRKRLIYSSIPGRGLKNLLEYYPLIKQKHPDAELHIFSSLDRTSRNWPPEEDLDQPLEKLRQSLARLSDCYVHKSILQKDLAREFMKSSILAYPTHFEETCCSTALEAQVAGCVTVTTKLGSLPETVGDTGLLIKGVPGKGDYAAKFIDAVDRLLSDDALFHTLSLKGLERAKQLDWKTKAEELICYLQEKHGL